MLAYLKRLAATGAAYTASSVIAKLIAVALLPLYTRHLTRVDYGAAEVLLATVVALSIVVRLGIIEALLRFYFQFEDKRERDDVVRSSFAFLLLTSTAGALVAAAFAGPLSEFLLDRRDTDLMLIAVAGLWVFTNYELLMALFRLDERARAYFAASIANVLLTVMLTVWLVVGEDEGARGLLVGNFAATAVILLVLVYVQRRRLALVPSAERLRPMLRFGLPTMPAELSLYALNFIDRIVLVRFVGLAEAGLYSLAVKFSQVVSSTCARSSSWSSRRAPRSRRPTPCSPGWAPGRLLARRRRPAHGPHPRPRQPRGGAALVSGWRRTPRSPPPSSPPCR